MAAPAVLLDLDGTLWDSWPWYARQVGRSDRARVRQISEALRRGRPVAPLLRDAGVTEASLRASCRTSGCDLYPGVRDALAQLRDGGTRLGIVTNLPRWIAIPMLEELGLAEHFDAVAHYSTTRRHKPHPDPILAVLDEMGVPPSTGDWYVGDTQADFEAAVAAGLSFAWASYGYGEPIPSAHKVIDQFDEVLRL